MPVPLQLPTSARAGRAESGGRDLLGIARDIVQERMGAAIDGGAHLARKDATSVRAVGSRWARRDPGHSGTEENGTAMFHQVSRGRLQHIGIAGRFCNKNCVNGRLRICAFHLQQSSFSCGTIRISRYSGYTGIAPYRNY